MTVAPVLFLPCALGTEALLCEEVERVLAGAAAVKAGRGGVEVACVAPAQGKAGVDEASRRELMAHAMRLNLESRLAQRVLWRVNVGSYQSEDDLYRLARQVDWSVWIRPNQTLRVDVSSRKSHLRSLNFAALLIKDAVCDDLRQRSGERPSVDTRHPDLPLVLHLDEVMASLYVDTSGEALFKRGWREDTGEAPLKETLAAAMLAAAGWHGRAEDGPLLDPCCGAGTIPIEAAQITCDIAPGLQRRFAFERLMPFAPLLAQWQELREAARARQRPPQVAIYAGDVAFRMTDFASRNAQRAGVAHAIAFKTVDALQRPAPCAAGVMMFNPPYGERMDTKGVAGGAYAATGEGEPEMGVRRQSREDFVDGQSQTFFSGLATQWKRQYGGWTAWVLTPDLKLPSALRLREQRRVVLFNGPIECRLFRFDLVAGRLQGPAQPEPDAAQPEQDSAQ